jgi:hypothetical protein
MRRHSQSAENRSASLCTAVVRALAASFLCAASLGLSASENQHQPPNADFLKNYFGNTLVCAASQTGEDVCHYWLNPDGTFVIIDSGGPHAGHWKLGPVRADGKTPVCQYWDSTAPVLPPELEMKMSEASATSTDAQVMSVLADGAVPARPDVVTSESSGAGEQTVCATNTDYKLTLCQRVPLRKLPMDAANKTFLQAMVDRFHNGICYPHKSQNVGDVWFEPDDPLPNQGGLDKLMLIKGRR